MDWGFGGMEPRTQAELLFEQVSRKVTPSAIEAAVEKRFARKLGEKIQAALGGQIKVRFVGSTARDTGLKGDQDIDLFVAFPRGRKLDSMVESLGKTLQEVAPAKWEMHYAEHPYYQAVINQFKVEVIPCYAISEQERIISAVDRTPLHMTYLQERLTPKQRRDVRVLKKLLKAANLYGAETEVQGFSGLVCEYLVLNYRDLWTLLENVAAWKPPVILDLENAYEGNRDAMVRLFPSPLVLVDFIDEHRNAAAAVGQDTLAKFVALARHFIAAPSMELFFPKKPVRPANAIAKALRSRLALIALEFPKPEGVVSDILVPQLRRTERSLRRHLELEEFKIHDSASFMGEKTCFVFLELESAQAPRIHKVFGPPVYFADDLRKFLAAHPKPVRGPYVEGGKAVVEVPRPLREAADLFESVRLEPARYAIASHFLPRFASLRVMDREKLLREAQRNRVLRGFLEAYLFKQDAFLR